MPQLPVSEELLTALARLKREGDSFEDLIWDLIEADAELSEETLREIEEARAEAARGETVSLDEYERARGL